jgi:serine/threonine protein kinase
MDNIINEHNIMRTLVGPHLVKGIFAFTYKHFYCIVMELMIGGDFRHVLEEEGRLDEDVA